MAILNDLAVKAGPRKLVVCAGLACVGAALLCGCGDDQYKQAAKKDPFAGTGTAVAQTEPVVPITPLPGGDLREDLGITRERYGQYSGRDLRDKADVFWRLYYLSKALQEGRAPSDAAGQLQLIRQDAGKMQADKNVSSITEIVDLLQTGMDASGLESRLSASGVRTASLGWAGGQYDLNRELQPGSATGSGARPRKLDAQAVRQASQFASKHHKAPLLVAQESYQRAAELTDQLGDAMDEERRQYGEHLIGRDTVDPSAGLGNPYERTFPVKPVR